MKTLTILPLVAAGLLAVVIPSARADQWNQKTTFTFSGPVEIPGQILPAGTYVFKLADSQADRNIVQVFNKNENHIYGTFLTVPDYRLRPTGKTVITFEERAAGTPEAVKAWFYPGDLYGNEFVYPRVRAAELAKQTQQPVPSMPQELAANTKTTAKTIQEPAVQALKQAPLKAENPSGGQVEVAQVFQTTPAPAPAASHPDKELPRTASLVPLLALIGLTCLGGAALLLAVTSQATDK